MRLTVYKIYFLLFFILLLGCSKKPLTKLSLSVHQVATAPEPVTNNAVSAAFIKGIPYIFSFGGLDSTKLYSGINQRNYRYNVKNNTWLQLPNLPDTLGKIASAATLIKDTIYIMGGYHVFKDGTEVSSNKVHRYAIKSNRFLTDGTPIPIPIDDHVQTVWRDSLIYIITGWSQKENIPNVQIYNPFKNSWQVGTSVPNNYKFKVFGANGIISKDTIYYFGGAAMGEFFPIQLRLRKGVINPKQPTNIIWSSIELDSTFSSYRMAATIVKNSPHFIGGSTSSYNYNGIAYDKNKISIPNNADFYYINGKLKKAYNKLLPMDLRGIASINDTVQYIYGGMKENNKVSNSILKLAWYKNFINESSNNKRVKN
ncbi:hypothetical protein Lupro_02070 [Lutibacter profundi]|uniref:Galactose oxidase n=1 Tax=Lutibacter profundi TaxID=1622118 RepID=A0A0X8G4W4_9FLAO|nr:hypothetical protein [Lutibacter profundi]AMC10108.1 hypothetical protein Lupro_02070 [Lutibacter profundi]